MTSVQQKIRFFFLFLNGGMFIEVSEIIKIIFYVIGRMSSLVEAVNWYEKQELERKSRFFF